MIIVVILLHMRRNRFGNGFNRQHPVTSFLNRREVTAADRRHNGGAGRRTFLQHWQERKRETITHPYLKEKIPWGLAPYVQALLLARHLRGDLDGYPPFLWK